MRQLTDPMPIVPPAVLYYGPPNMKVNPADIKVVQNEEDLYPYYEEVYEDQWAEQFIQQYQDIFQAQQPAKQAPN